MNYQILKLPDEPILIASFYGELTPTVHYHASLEVADLIEKTPGTLYRINDTTKATFSLMAMIAMLNQGLKGWPGTASDPRVISLMVVNGGNAFLGLNHLLRSWGGSDRVHTFLRMADALAYAREKIAETAQKSQGVRLWEETDGR